MYHMLNVHRESDFEYSHDRYLFKYKSVSFGRVRCASTSYVARVVVPAGFVAVPFGTPRNTRIFEVTWRHFLLTDNVRGSHILSGVEVGCVQS